MDAISMAMCPPKRPKQSFEWESWWAVSRDNLPWAGNGLIWPSSPKVDPEKVARCIDSYSINSTRWCIFYVHPYGRGRWTHFESYFSDGLGKKHQPVMGLIQKSVIHLETVGCRFTNGIVGVSLSTHPGPSFYGLYTWSRNLDQTLVSIIDIIS